MSRIRTLVLTSAIAGLALAGLAGPASADPAPKPNNPAYYGSNCVKVEYVDGTRTYHVPANTTVHIKAATVIYTFSGGYAGRTITLEKDISFVITCPGGGSGYPS